LFYSAQRKSLNQIDKTAADLNEPLCYSTYDSTELMICVEKSYIEFLYFFLVLLGIFPI